MGDVDQIIAYTFLIAILLVIVAYYAGFVADIQAFGASLNTLILTATGRNSAGQFAAYPTGAPAA